MANFDRMQNASCMEGSYRENSYEILDPKLFNGAKHMHVCAFCRSEDTEPQTQALFSLIQLKSLQQVGTASKIQQQATFPRYLLITDMTDVPQHLYIISPRRMHESLSVCVS